MNAPVPRTALETVAERIRHLQAEARSLATQHVHDLVETMAAVESLAAEIETFGEAVPPGVRDICRKLAEDASGKAQTITALMERQP